MKAMEATDLAIAKRLHTASVASGLQPIAAGLHCIIAKNSTAKTN